VSSLSCSSTRRRSVPNGCALDAVLASCIVAIADIEAITGLDFFAAFDDALEALLQTPDGDAVWLVLVGR
jgi:hypothetical protein